MEALLEYGALLLTNLTESREELVLALQRPVCRRPRDGEELTAEVARRDTTWTGLERRKNASGRADERLPAGRGVEPGGRIESRDIGPSFGGGQRHGTRHSQAHRARLPEHPLRDSKKFVLSEFSREEKRALDEILERGAQAVRSVIGDGIAKAMSSFNSEGQSAKGKGQEGENT